jgi:hypothetical protein
LVLLLEKICVLSVQLDGVCKRSPHFLTANFIDPYPTLMHNNCTLNLSHQTACSIHNNRSPRWIQTIPLSYEYGSESSFYVRIWEADDTNAEDQDANRKSQSPNNRTPNSDDASVRSESFFGTSPKKRMGYCFGTALFEVGDILGSKNYTKVKRLKSGGWYVRFVDCSKCCSLICL